MGLSGQKGSDGTMHCSLCSGPGGDRLIWFVDPREKGELLMENRGQRKPLEGRLILN